MTFNVELRNPCIDTAYVNIVSPLAADFPSLDHLIFDDGKTFAPHGPFTIAFSQAPVDNTDLCGSVQLEAFWMVPFEGSTIKTAVPASNSDPLTYNPATRQWSADTDNITLLEYNLGIYTILVDATLASY